MCDNIVRSRNERHDRTKQRSEEEKERRADLRKELQRKAHEARQARQRFVHELQSVVRNMMLDLRGQFGQMHGYWAQVCNQGGHRANEAAPEQEPKKGKARKEKKEA
jgi:hypothetical protein